MMERHLLSASGSTCIVSFTIASIFDVKVLLEAGRDVARGKLSRVATALPGARLKSQLPTLIQAPRGLGVGGRECIAGQA